MRHEHAREFRQLLAQGHEVVCLLPVIQLAQEALAELLQHRAKLVTLARLGMPIEEARDLVERVQVLEHFFANARPLHLHRHPLAAAQARAMHLA